MKLQEFLNLQDKLDIEIMLNCTARGVKITDNEILNSKLVALFTEAGEFANEVQSFKYWKKNKNIDDDKVLEELADIYFFLFSITNQLDYCAADIEKAYLKKHEKNMLRQKEGY
jgi:dimeric dUTPase (all-alpha-NTP-PPase superfamily)